MPKLKCPTFSGNSEDKFAFKNFLSSFESYVSALRSDADKLQVLRGYLSGYPASVISNLSISDENYGRAIELLKAEFLDLDLIKSEIFDDLIEGISCDNSLDSLRQFLTKIKANLCELQSSHNLNFYEENTPGARLIAHLIFKKLPNFVKGEIIRISGTNYPPISFILNNFSAVFKTLESTRRDVKNRSVSKASAPVLEKPSFKPTLQNFQTEITPERPGCNFSAVHTEKTSINFVLPLVNEGLDVDNSPSVVEPVSPENNREPTSFNVVSKEGPADKSLDHIGIAMTLDPLTAKSEPHPNEIFKTNDEVSDAESCDHPLKTPIELEPKNASRIKLVVPSPRGDFKRKHRRPRVRASFKPRTTQNNFLATALTNICILNYMNLLSCLGLCGVLPTVYCGT